MNPATLLREGIGWLHLLAVLAGVLVAAPYLGQSRWVGVLFGGFLVEAVVSMLYRVMGLFLARAITSYEAVGAVYLMASLLGLAAQIAIVVGVAGVLAELKGKVRAS